MTQKSRPTLIIGYTRPAYLPCGYWINASDDSAWFQENDLWVQSLYTRAELVNIATGSTKWTIMDKTTTPPPGAYGAF